MGSKIEYSKGDILGNNGISYIEEVSGRTVKNNGNKVRMALFLCTCGKKFVARISFVKFGSTASCGCKSGNIVHGLSGTYEYRIWKNIKKRCYNKKFPAYKNYGFRGISVSKEFINDPVLFVNYIKSLDNYGTDGYTLDRINNDGNYERGNLRWADKSIQTINRRKARNKSGFIGVAPSNSYLNWRASVSYKYKKYFLGYFNTAKEAAVKRDLFIVSNGLPNELNFPPQYKEQTKNTIK